MKLKPPIGPSKIESLDLAIIHVNKVATLATEVRGNIQGKHYMNAAQTLMDMNQSLQLVAGYVNKLLTK